ncbi:MAG: hypothetical protein ACOVMG_05370, partial [Flavobacterium sp.]
MNFVEITSNDNWFKRHPEKIAGVEYETTSFYFPIMVKGTKEDVLRVTGINKVEQKEEVITVPVIRYKNDGNYIAKNSITIKNYNNIKGFYLSEKPFEVTNYATNYRVIFKLKYNGKTVYFEDGIYSLQAIESKVNQDFVNKVIEDS